MKVYTKLVNMEFVIGSMKRDGHNLVIRSDTSKSMPAEVVMSPQDAVVLLKAAFNWSTISFVLGLPYLYFKTRKAKSVEDDDE